MVSPFDILRWRRPCHVVSRRLLGLVLGHVMGCFIQWWPCWLRFAHFRSITLC